MDEAFVVVTGTRRDNCAADERTTCTPLAMLIVTVIGDRGVTVARVGNSEDSNIMVSILTTSSSSDGYIYG